MSTETYRLLARTLSSLFPDTPVHCQSQRPINARSIPLDQTATFFDYAVLNGSRYYASRATGSNRSSLVEVGIGHDIKFGELLEIFEFDQGKTGSPLRFGRMRWFKESTGPHEPVWDI